jgi:serine/threonine protein kinase
VALPRRWQATGWQTESGQAWLHQVATSDDGDLHALKRLKNANRSDRFRREVETMIRLRDEHGAMVPSVVDADLDDEHPWFVMPWCEGGSLQAAVDDGRYRDDLVGGIAFLTQLAEALADVHAAGVAHRDLKPANVLTDVDGPLLTDFGLCFDADEPRTRLTDADEAVGSRLYIAPENESGLNEDADQRPADFYAYGKTVWAALAGRRPLARELVTEPGNRLADLLGNAGLAPLDNLLRDLTNPDPRVRLRDWQVVISELESVRRTLAGDATRVPRAVDGDPVRLADRFRRSGLVAQRIDAVSEQARKAAWFGQLVEAMQEEGRRGFVAIQTLADELSDVLQIAVSRGAPPEPGTVVLAGLEVPARRKLPIDALMSATTFVIHSHQGVEALPTLALTVSPMLTDDGLMLVRIPSIAEAELPQRPPSFLPDSLTRLAGPFPEGRHSTIEAAREIVRETAQLFVSLTQAYVELVGRERSPADPEAWKDIDFQPTALVDSIENLGDISPPELRSLDILPALVRSDGGLEVRVRARIVDRQAGIAREGYRSSPSQVLLQSRSGQTAFGMLTPSERVEGDDYDGVYEAVARLDRHAERGRWTLESVLLVDQVGNSRRHTTAELSGLGFPTRITLE